MSLLCVVSLPQSMIFKDWTHMAQRPDARTAALSLPHQSELGGKQPSDDTARKEGAGAASAKLKLEALSS